jgi:hypothetical protein
MGSSGTASSQRCPEVQIAVSATIMTCDGANKFSTETGLCSGMQDFPLPRAEDTVGGRA